MGDFGCFFEAVVGAQGVFPALFSFAVPIPGVRDMENVLGSVFSELVPLGIFESAVLSRLPDDYELRVTYYCCSVVSVCRVLERVDGLISVPSLSV